MQLEPIPEHKRKTEKQFWDYFNQEKAEIFSGLLSAVSLAIANIDLLKLNSLPRMADFACWATAAERGLGLTEGTFLTVYMKNRDNAHDIVLEGSQLAEIIKQFAEGKGDFEGTMKEFLQELNKLADEETRKNKEYPKTARGLSTKLCRLAPNLRGVGVNIQFLPKTNKGRMISLEYAHHQPSQPSPSLIIPEIRIESDDDSKLTSLLDDHSIITNEHSTVKSFSNGNEDKHQERGGLKTDSDGSDGLRHNFSTSISKCNSCGLEMNDLGHKYFCPLGCGHHLKKLEIASELNKADYIR
jgi:hypothetical protein